MPKTFWRGSYDRAKISSNGAMAKTQQSNAFWHYLRNKTNT